MLPTVAVKLSENIFEAIADMTNTDIDPDLFGANAYVVLEQVGPVEFNMKLMTEDAMFEAFKNDSQLQIIHL